MCTTSLVEEIEVLEGMLERISRLYEASKLTLLFQQATKKIFSFYVLRQLLLRFRIALTPNIKTPASKVVENKILKTNLRDIS